MDRGNQVSTSRQIFDRLLGLTGVLGVAEQDVLRAETASRLNLTTNMPAKPAAGLKAEMLQAIVSDWDGHFSLAVTSDYGIREFRLQDGHFDQGQLDLFLQDAATAPPEATIQIRLAVDKEQFLGTQAQIPSLRRVLFLFTDNLKQALAGGYADIQEIFFPPGIVRCECLLYQDDVTIRGQYLTISNSPARPLPEQQDAAQLNSRLETIRSLQQDNVHWMGFGTTLTPLQFVVRKDVDPQGIGERIERLQYALLVSYIADSTRSVETGFVAVFAGSSRTDILLPAQRGDGSIDTSFVLRLFEWCYAERASDKLDIARGVISSMLGADRSANYNLLLANGGRAWEAARSTYTMLVADLVTKHFDKLKQLQDYVTAVSSDVASKVSSIVTALITNILAAIAVVLGAFVAFAFDNKIKPDVFKLGLRVYGFYILAFPLAFSLLLNNLVDYLIVRSDFKRRLKDFETALGLKNLRVEVASAVTRRAVHFWIIFSFSLLIYLALASVCFFISRVLVLPHSP